MSTRSASQVRHGDVLIFRVSNGQTLARVQDVRETSEAEVAEYCSDPKPLVAIDASLQRSLQVPDMPGWKTQRWTLFVEPGVELELYERMRGAV